MEGQIHDLNTDALVDIFSGSDVQSSQKQGVRFGTEEMEADIFSQSGDKLPDEQKIDSEETKPDDDVKIKGEGAEEKGGVAEEQDADILSSQQKPGRKPKYDFSDMSGYYQDRVKNKKFVAIEEEDEKGNKVLFVPKTPEEFDEVIEIQVNHKLEQERKNLEQKIFEGKSPAWKAALQFAEMIEDPSEMIPFLTGVKNIQSVSDMNPDEIDGAESIVRVRLEQRGDPQEAIEAQIEALKTTDKLISTAKQYKPIILQQEQQALASQVQENRRRQEEYTRIVSSVRENVIRAIEQPIFGKQKLKNDEKAAIYDLIGEPSTDTQGYGIYTAIDNLFETGDFDSLREVALLLAKKDSFYKYSNLQSVNNTAASLQRKLSVATESKGSIGSDIDLDPETPVVQRNQYTKKVRFGRD